MSVFNLPVDSDGQILPHDHPDLSGQALIVRGVASYHIVQDHNRNCQRLSSALFKCDPNRQGYLSFSSQVCIEAAGEAPGAYVLQRNWIGAVGIAVDDFRSFDPATEVADRWKIGMVPILDEEPPDACHGAVWGKINESRANGIRRAVHWVAEIPEVVLDETKL